MTEKPVVDIFTDGACSGNPGPGGWGALMRYGTVEKELSGGEEQTTNNRMEMMAAIAALEALKSGDAYRVLEERGWQLEGGLSAAARLAGVPVQFNRCGSMFCAYFANEPVHNLDDAMKSDRERFAKYFHGMLDEGIYLAPSQFEAGFISTAHTTADIEQTIAAAERVLKGLR